MKKIITEFHTNATRYIIDTVFAIIAFFLATRFILKLFEVNNANMLVDFVYRVAGIFIFPFKNIVNDFKLGDNFTFESSTFIALIIISLLYWLISGIFTKNRYTVIHEETTDFLK